LQSIGTYTGVLIVRQMNPYRHFQLGFDSVQHGHKVYQALLVCQGINQLSIWNKQMCPLLIKPEQIYPIVWHVQILFSCIVRWLVIDA
jgi:hypothetical protein